MQAGPQNLSAAIYTRLSKGFGRSIEEQEAEDRAECGRLGWGIADVYSDASRSASRFATKGREDWARLLADLDSGRFGVLMLWEPSRGDRDAESWLGLLNLCRRRGVKIHITSHGHTYDMTRRRDWRALADEGIDSADESEKISERIRRDVRANAALGRPHGKTPYGYERIYDSRTKQLAEQRPDPRTAPVVAEIYWRVGSGEPVLAIARDLNARGEPAPGGKQWSRVMIRNIATSPVYAGRRVWKGEQIPGIWQPLVDEAAWHRAKRVLTDPSRARVRPTRARHLLSYIGQCGECGAPLAAAPRGAKRNLYGCSERGCVFIREDWLDDEVTRRVIAILSSAEIYRARQGASDAAVLAAMAEADKLQERLDEMAGQAARGEIELRALSIGEAELRPKIRAAHDRANAAAVPLEIRDLAEHRESMPDVWLTMPLARKKQLLRTLIADGALCVKVRKPQPGGVRGKFDPARVVTEPGR
jgi:DNA invertase Pin-like site-specific DNA recombinase